MSGKRSRRHGRMTQSTLDGSTVYDVEHELKFYETTNKNGNVVIGISNACFLMLDVDARYGELVKEFAFEYAEYHNLGSVLIMKTSYFGQTDLYGNPIASYCIIFGELITWEEISWHVTEANRLQIVEDNFLALRKFGFITIRTNDKNDLIQYPKFYAFFGNGSMKGIMTYLRFWKITKEAGKAVAKETQSERMKRARVFIKSAYERQMLREELEQKENEELEESRKKRSMVRA